MHYPENLKKVDELRAAIAAHGPMDAEVLKRINYKFRLEWNYTSNSMEGNTLTRAETRSVMIGNITVHGKPIKDVYEMQGHDKAITDILKMGAGELNLSESRIRELHRAIMHEDDPEKAAMIGRWKTQDNYVINSRGERHDYRPHADVPDAMHGLMNWLSGEREKIARDGAGALHPALLAFRFHLDYLSIHPFHDGNGRTARILTNIILIAYGYPPLWVGKGERDAYYQYLADVQAYGGSPDVLYDFMAGLLVRSQQLVLDAVEGREIEEPGDYLKELELIKKRVEHESIPKSPKVVYETFENVKRSVWSPLELALNNFNNLFNERKDFNSVNSLPERYETEVKNLLSSPFIKEISKAPKRVKIYGHDVYEEDIQEIVWEQKHYALKGSTGNIDFRIVNELSFGSHSYSLRIRATSRASDKRSLVQLVHLNKPYGYIWNEEEVEEMKTLLGKHLVTAIQSYLNPESL